MTKPKRLIGRDILRTSVLKTERVDVPEWDGEIILRAMSATLQSEFARQAKGKDGTDPLEQARMTALAFLYCWIDEEGAAVLTVDDLDEFLATQTPDLVKRLSMHALRLSGMTAEAPASAAKNSVSSQSNDSGTPSPLRLAA